MAMFQVVSGETVLFSFRANFSRATSPIQVCDGDGASRSDTPFRVSDSRSPIAAAKLVNGWQRSKGGKSWERGARGLVLRRVL